MKLKIHMYYFLNYFSVVGTFISYSHILHYCTSLKSCSLKTSQTSLYLFLVTQYVVIFFLVLMCLPYSCNIAVTYPHGVMTYSNKLNLTFEWSPRSILLPLHSSMLRRFYLGSRPICCMMTTVKVDGYRKV